jgi:LysM repeat protein
VFTIAQQFGVTTQAIISANNLTNPDRLSIGQQLIIPPAP